MENSGKRSYYKRVSSKIQWKKVDPNFKMIVFFNVAIYDQMYYLWELPHTRTTISSIFGDFFSLKF